MTITDSQPEAANRKRRRLPIILFASALAVAAIGLAAASLAGPASHTLTLSNGTTVEVSEPRVIPADELPGDEYGSGTPLAIDAVVTVGSEPISPVFLDADLTYGESEQECDSAGVSYILGEGATDVPDTLYPGETLAVTYYSTCHAKPGERLIVEVSYSNLGAGDYYSDSQQFVTVMPS